MKQQIQGRWRSALLCGAMLAASQSGALAQASVSASASTAAAGMLAQSDPLATQAPRSARAAKSLLLALASAGKRMVAVGERGIVVYSDDQGAHWIQAKVPVSVTLTAVSFVDARQGWAVGHDGVILATQDGGQNWTKQLDGNAVNAMMLADAQAAQARASAAAAAAPKDKAAQDAQTQADNAMGDLQAGIKFGPSRPFLSVWFKDASVGYAVGAFGQAIRTVDGGVHWESMTAHLVNPDGLHYNAIGPGLDGALLIAGEGGKIYQSNDGGNAWKTFDTGYKGQLYGALPIEGGLLAFGFGGHMLASSDAGAHWQSLAPLTGKSLVQAAHAPDGSLVLLAKDGSVLHSSDQGRSFQVGAPGRGLELAAMLPFGSPAAPQFVLAGVGGIHLSSDTAGAQ